MLEKRIFDLDIEKCVGCGACAIACMDQNDREPEKGDRLFRNIGNIEFPATGTKIRYLSLGCMHCDDAPCVTACPCNVLHKNAYGLTVYDNTGCIGCHSCLLACPYGVPTFADAPGSKMEKCNGCAVRLENGLQPACVRICPTKALTCMTEEEYCFADLTHSLRTMMHTGPEPKPDRDTKGRTGTDA